MRSTAATLATALLVALAGCLQDAPDADDGLDAPEATPRFTPQTVSFAGTFLLGGVDGPQEHAFEVPAGAGEVEAVLTWSLPAAVLDFALLDPTGAEAADGWGESDTHRYVTTTQPPPAGAWRAVVTAEQGVQVDYQLDVTVREAEPFGPIGRTYTVPGGEFAEVNLNMAPGDRFDHSWTSDADVYFNIHYHADGSTERPVEHTGTSLAGNFTAPETQVYSLLWRNEGTLPVEVRVAMDGTYRLHSMTRDAPPA